jgi:hypothetical protein
MAQIVNGSNNTSLASFFLLIGPFLSSNGWTLDKDESNRIHAHKGTSHFELYLAVTSTVSLVGCTGYDSGAAWNAQPGSGTEATTQSNLIQSDSTHPLYYVFVSTENAFYAFLKSTYSNAEPVISFGVVENKIGGWSNGEYYTLGNSPESGSLFSSTGYQNGSVRIDGTWTPLSQTGGACGLRNLNISLRSAMPFTYSAGILPNPIMLFQRDPTTNTLFHPIGFLPDIFAFNGGDIYEQFGEVEIGVDTYTAINNMAGYTDDPPNFLLKLGS